MLDVVASSTTEELGFLIRVCVTFAHRIALTNTFAILLRLPELGWQRLGTAAAAAVRSS
jgi:hypothetical protein